MKKLSIIIEPTTTGYSAYISEINGIAGAGDTLDEVVEDIKEALAFYLDDKKGKLEDFDFTFKVSIDSFFELFSFINITSLSGKVDINPSLMRQYARGIKNPSLTQAKKIEKAIHEIANQLSRVNITNRTGKQAV